MCMLSNKIHFEGVLGQDLGHQRAKQRRDAGSHRIICFYHLHWPALSPSEKNVFCGFLGLVQIEGCRFLCILIHHDDNAGKQANMPDMHEPVPP